MIQIDTEKCIGCGSCVKDCFAHALELKDKTVEHMEKRCIECGHCIAVCPTDAVTLQGYDMNECLDYDAIDFEIDPEVYLNHLKARRTIRRFRKETVKAEDIRTILEAGRYSPTGGNMQDVAYYVSQKELQTLKLMIMEELRTMGEEAKAIGGRGTWYSALWLKIYDKYVKDGKDNLFFNADTVIVISSDSPQAACIAAAHMETMVYALGLGMVYSGFATRAIAHSKKLREYLHLKDGYDVHAVLVMGHPDVKYLRTVPRKPADAIWN